MLEDWEGETEAEINHLLKKKNPKMIHLRAMVKYLVRSPRTCAIQDTLAQTKQFYIITVYSLFQLLFSKLGG